LEEAFLSLEYFPRAMNLTRQPHTDTALFLPAPASKNLPYLTKMPEVMSDSNIIRAIRSIFRYIDARKCAVLTMSVAMALKLLGYNPPLVFLSSSLLK
jgi:hypothetical protein